MGASEAAVELKNKGNDAFKNKDFPAAIDLYSQAIKVYDKEPSFFTNRAQVGPTSGIFWSSSQRIRHISN